MVIPSEKNLERENNPYKTLSVKWYLENRKDEQEEIKN